MVKIKNLIFIILILFFLLFSLYPTIFEFSKKDQLADKNREFILEHNYYWPDYNLYLSKIRQGFEGSLTATEKYTSERHNGSLIQEFYVILGHLGRFLGLTPNYAYLLGRIVLSLLLLLVILKLIKYYFPSFLWQFLAFLIVVTSGSFPRFYTDASGILQVGRYMEWWSNIDALQRITFIPHILFGQVVSFYLLYRLTMNYELRTNNLIIYIFLGNILGLTFPPSLITLLGVLLLSTTLKIITHVFILFKNPNVKIQMSNKAQNSKSKNIFEIGILDFICNLDLRFWILIFSLPSLLYIFILTKQIPWSALVTFHRTHPMMIPFWEYILGTGPIFFLGFAGMVLSIIKRERKFVSLSLWILLTFFFAIFFTHIRDQSPLRFTQTGLFIPLGILGAYFFYHLLHLSDLSDLGRRLIKTGVFSLLILYILGSLYMMTVSLNWQITWITQRLRATIPAIPYPPQAMYPLKAWMDGIRWLRNNTNHDEAVLAEVTAGNYIPAYSGNTVYFGQANTLDYEHKQSLVTRFFKGEMGQTEAEIFLKEGRVKYIFYSIQEKEIANGKDLPAIYRLSSFKKPVFSNPTVTIYTSFTGK